MASVWCALVLSGCSSTSDPNAGSGYRFPGDGAAPQAPLPTMQSTVLRVNDMITVTFSDVPNPPGLQEIRARIPASVGEFPINDPDGTFFGFAVSGYGLMWNTRYCRPTGYRRPGNGWISPTRAITATS